MDAQLDANIRYHERIVQQAKVRELPSIQTLEELTIKYLKELKAIKEKEGVKGNEN